MMGRYSMDSVNFKIEGREVRDRRTSLLRRRVCTAITCGALALAVSASPALASGNDLAQEGGTGALAALATLIYGPVKIVYATGGLIFGGLAYAFSGGNMDVLNAVLTPAVRGDYVITPKVVVGDGEWHFLGQDPRYRDEYVASEDVF